MNFQFEPLSKLGLIMINVIIESKTCEIISVDNDMQTFGWMVKAAGRDYARLKSHVLECASVTVPLYHISVASPVHTAKLFCDKVGVVVQVPWVVT